MSPESPMYPMLIESIVDNMNLSNREEVIAKLKQVNQPNPEAVQLQQQVQQIELAKQQASLENIQAQTAEIVTRVQQNTVETQLLPVEAETERLDTLLKNLGGEDKEFAKRVKAAELVLKERELETKEDIVEMQMRK